MPLTNFQAAIARLLSTNRSPDSYLAGGAALHIEPNSTRYSNDLDPSARPRARSCQDARILLGTGTRGHTLRLT